MNWRSTKFLQSKNEVRHSKIKLSKMIMVLAICLSLVTATFSQVSRPTAQRGSTAGTRRPPGNVVPEALPLLVYLMDRYAKNITDKTELDRGVERALAGVRNSRQVAAELVARFKRIPLEQRRASFGRLADVSATQRIPEAEIKSTFKRLVNLRLIPKTLPDRLELPQAPTGVQRISGSSGLSDGLLRQAMAYSEEPASLLTPVSLPRSTAGSTVHLRYQGLYCQNETRRDGFTRSDEIYITTSVIEVNSARVVTTRHPYTRHHYTSVDSGEVREAPILSIWSGAAQDLSLVSVVMENDPERPEWLEKVIDAVVKIVVFVVKVATGYEIPRDVASAAGDLIERALSALIGFGDDLIEQQFVYIPKSRLLGYTRTPMREWRPSERQPYLYYHFFTDHRGRSFRVRDAHYYVMFGVNPTVDPPPPVPVTVRIHRVKQIDNLDRGGRGQADFKGSIIIDGEEKKLSQITGDEITPTYQWFFRKPDVRSNNVTITLKLYDDDPRRREDHCDINPRPGVKELTFTYDRATGRITGYDRATGLVIEEVTGMKGRVIHVRGAGDNHRAEIWFSVDLTDDLI